MPGTLPGVLWFASQRHSVREFSSHFTALKSEAQRGGDWPLIYFLPTLLFFQGWVQAGQLLFALTEQLPGCNLGVDTIPGLQAGVLRDSHSFCGTPHLAYCVTTQMPPVKCEAQPVRAEQGQSKTLTLSPHFSPRSAKRGF